MNQQIGIDFIDILFGLVVTDIFTNFTIIRRHEYATWANLSLVLAIVVFSWIGYHKAKEAYQRPLAFKGWVFPQFLLDIAIVGVYLALVDQVAHTLSVSRNKHVLSIRPEAATIAVIFLMYLLWDMMQRARSSGPEHTKAKDHSHLSAGVFVLVAGYSAVIISVWRPSSNVQVILADGIYLVISYLYRLGSPTPTET